jgi:hypothetical protein
MKPPNGSRAQALTALFGLVREGVILSFRTNFFGQSSEAWYPQVSVKVIGTHDEASLCDVGHRVLAVLSPLLGSAKVTVIPVAHSHSEE